MSEIQVFWDKMHMENNIKFLTGSTGPKVWKQLNITNLIKKDKVVLNIGVGLGYCSFALKEKQVQLHCLDISQVALDRVRKIAKVWLASELNLLPSNTFDLAISYLVTQHISDIDLKTQLVNVIRALKPEGIFAMQFAFDTNEKNKLSVYTNRNFQNGGVCRDLNYITKLVSEANGKIVWISKPTLYLKQQAGFYSIHIKKKDAQITHIQPIWIQKIKLRRQKHE